MIVAAGYYSNTVDFGAMNGLGGKTMQEPQYPFGPVPLNGSLSNNLLCILYKNLTSAHIFGTVNIKFCYGRRVESGRNALLPPSFGMLKMDIF